MLVYVRVSDWPHVVCSASRDDLAPHLRDRFEAERLAKERRQKEKAEAHLYCHVRLARDADMREQVGARLFFDRVDYAALPEGSSFRIQKHTKFGEFKKLVR